MSACRLEAQTFPRTRWRKRHRSSHSTRCCSLTGSGNFRERKSSCYLPVSMWSLDDSSQHGGDGVAAQPRDGAVGAAAIMSTAAHRARSGQTKHTPRKNHSDRISRTESRTQAPAATQAAGGRGAGGGSCGQYRGGPADCRGRGTGPPLCGRGHPQGEHAGRCSAPRRSPTRRSGD